MQHYMKTLAASGISANGRRRSTRRRRTHHRAHRRGNEPHSVPVRHKGSYDARDLPDLDGASVNAGSFGAGHSFSATTTISSASELVAQIRKEHDDAVVIVRALLTTVDGGRPT